MTRGLRTVPTAASRRPHQKVPPVSGSDLDVRIESISRRLFLCRSDARSASCEDEGEGKGQVTTATRFLAATPRTERREHEVLVLSAAATAAVLERPVVGRGVFQTLFRRIRTGVVGRTLTISRRDVDTLVGMASRERGQYLGGYQRRAVKVIAEVMWWRLCVPRRLKVLPFQQAPRQLWLPFEAAA